MLKIIFTLISVLLFLNISLGKIFIFDKSNSILISKCGVSMGIFFALYSMTALCFAVFDVSLIHKIIFLLIALSPFLIGKITTYKTIQFFTIFQLFVIFLGVIFVSIIN